MGNDWILNHPAERDRRQKGLLRSLMMRWYAPNEKGVMETVYKISRKLPKNKFGELAARGIAAFMNRVLTYSVVVTRQELFEFIESLPDDFKITLGNCPCKELTQAREGLDGTLKGETCFSCATPLETDVQIGEGSRFYVEKVPSFRYITKEELIEHEKKLLDMGLVPNVYLFCRGESAICNCSPISCIPMIANREIGGYRLKVLLPGRYGPAPGRLCRGCGECLSPRFVL